MSENLSVGDQNPNGAEGNQPAVSQGQGQPITPATPPQDFVSKKDFDNAVRELRGLQSRQDKSQTEQTRFMDELKKQIAKGKTLEEAEIIVNEQNTAREKDDLLFRVAEKLGVSSPSLQQAPAGNGSPVTVDMAKIIGDNKLDGNDPEVIAEILSKQWNSPLEAENAALKLVNRRLNPTPPDLSATPVVVGNPPRPAGIDKLTEDYKKEMQAARGKPANLRAIKDKYVKQGVNIHEVDFT